MNPEGDSADGGACFQQSTDSVAAIGPMGLVRAPFNRVIRFRTVDPFVAMHPEPKLELHAAGNGLLGYELQHLEVLIALGIRQLRNPHVVTGHRQEKWIGE